MTVPPIASTGTATGKVWKFGSQWVAFAQDESDGRWIRHYGFKTELEAVWEADALVAKLDDERARRVGSPTSSFRGRR